MSGAIIGRDVVSHNAAPAQPLPRHDTADADSAAATPTEIGGRGGLEPTRYGDWEKNGRCIDF